MVSEKKEKLCSRYTDKFSNKTDFTIFCLPSDHPPAWELILIIKIETSPEISAADREGQVLTVRKSESSDADPAIENPTLELSSG